jgi:hypothetical protein
MDDRTRLKAASQLRCLHDWWCRMQTFALRLVATGCRRAADAKGCSRAAVAYVRRVTHSSSVRVVRMVPVWYGGTEHAIEPIHKTS